MGVDSLMALTVYEHCISNNLQQLLLSQQESFRFMTLVTA